MKLWRKEKLCALWTGWRLSHCGKQQGLPPKPKNGSWGDGSVGTVLTVQALETEFRSPAPKEKLGVTDSTHL